MRYSNLISVFVSVIARDADIIIDLFYRFHKIDTSGFAKIVELREPHARSYGMKILIASLCLTLLLPSVLCADGLEKLPYNHSGLHVDLGVGLWAWPVPCDADGDGDFDLIVSCPEKPSNGVWLFENATGDTAKEKMPVFKAPRRLSATVHYVLPITSENRLE